MFLAATAVVLSTLCPVLHEEHSTLPGTEERPSGQNLHICVMDISVYVFSLHSSHLIDPVTFCCLPGSHGTHVAWPGPSSLQPRGHSLHLVESWSSPDRNWPALQNMQPSPYLPASHRRQEADPTRSTLCPIGQREHVELFTLSENFPFEQSSHWDFPLSSWCLPGTHGKQLDSPATSAYHPTGHSWHVAAVVLLPERYFPTAQSVHGVPLLPPVHSRQRTAPSGV